MVTIDSDISLRSHNTFGIDIIAHRFAIYKSIEELQHILADPSNKDVEKMILGGGSNVLFTQNFNGIVLKNAIQGIEIIRETEDYYFVKCSSGESWHAFVLFCIDHDMGGVENLSLIPGSVGAAPMQNIGAYGVELTQVFESLEAIHISTQERREFSHAECRFGYRESVFKKELKGQYVIVSVTFRLTKKHQLNLSYGAIRDLLIAKKIHQPTIRDVSEVVMEIRRSKLPDPSILGNAGSFFKNPEIDEFEFQQLQNKYAHLPFFKLENGDYKIPAGWLIEQCGWKGKVVGNTGAHKDQALVLVNYGKATGSEIWSLALAIQQSVQQQFDIYLSPEVNIY
jgi:UDP-N-acetylmuramate dehydrogenase